MEHSENFGMVELGPRTYGDGAAKSLWIPPTLPGNTAPLHPLATWYAVLFGLSELARYQPITWARAININTSADATALEHLMSAAHLACVNLIAELFEIRHPPHDDLPEGWTKHTERVFAWQRQSRRGRSRSGRLAAVYAAGLRLGAGRGQPSAWSLPRCKLDAGKLAEEWAGAPIFDVMVTDLSGFQGLP